MIFITRALPILCMAFFCFYLLTTQVVQLFSFVPDDAGYYFKIAKNLASGSGSSFDGIHATNGYQPMWLLVLTAVHWVLTLDSDGMLRLILIFQFGVAVLALGVLTATVNRFFKESVSVPVLMIAIFTAVLPSINGMESTLLLAVISALIFLFTGRTDPCEMDCMRSYCLGLAVGIVVLCRLDLIFMPIAAGIVWLVSIITDSHRRVSRLLALAVFAVGTVCAVLPYLSLNFISTGHLMPISGVLKSGFPNINSPLVLPAHLDFRSIFGLIGAHIYLLAILARSFRLHVVEKIGRAFHFTTLTLCLAVSFHFIHTVLFMKWAIFWWHYAFYALVGAIVFGVAIDYVFRHLTERNQQILGTMLTVVVASVTVTWIKSKFDEPLDNNWVVQSYLAGQFAKANTGPGTIFAMKDAGIFGYVSERRTINLDGLVNDYYFQRVLRDQDLARYLMRNRVAYLAQHAIWDRPDVVDGSYQTWRFSLRSQLYDVDSDVVEVASIDEVYRSPSYFDGRQDTVFIIWRLSELVAHKD